jgi:hypothetical protein
VFGPVTFNDNCDGEVIPVVTNERVGGVTEAGCDSVFTRTWTATDGCGNVTIVTQSITVPCCPPACPPGLATISYGGPLCVSSGFATVTLTGITGGTFSSTTGLVIDVNTGTINLSTSSPGTYIVTYSFIGPLGCIGAETTEVTIINDSEAPVASGDTTDRRADCNTPFGDLVFGPVTFSDNGHSVIPVVETIHSVGSGCDSVFTRTWTATDDCGNTTIVNQSITVKYDSEAPVASGDTADSRVACNTPYADLVFGPVTFNDNCDGAVIPVVTNERVGGVTEAGCDSVFTRTWTATDGCGNTTIVRS